MVAKVKKGHVVEEMLTKEGLAAYRAGKLTARAGLSPEAQKTREEYERIFKLEEEHAEMSLALAKLRAENATLRRSVANLEGHADALRERLRWITTLATTQQRPRELADSKPPQDY